MSFAGEAFTKDTWFDRPKQVAVMMSDNQGVETFVGIAYRDEVICLCCAATFDMDILEGEGAVYKVLPWHDLDFQVRKLSDPFEENRDSKS